MPGIGPGANMQKRGLAVRIELRDLDATPFRGVYSTTLHLKLDNEVRMPNVMLELASGRVRISEGSLVVLKAFLDTQSADADDVLSSICTQAQSLLNH